MNEERDQVPSLGEKISKLCTGVGNKASLICKTTSLMINSGETEKHQECPTGPQPVSLNKVNMRLVKPSKYFVSLKADGTRYMFVSLDKKMYMIGRKSEVMQLKGVTPETGGFVLDGEAIIDKITHELVFIIFDVLALDYKSTTNIAPEVRAMDIYEIISSISCQNTSACFRAKEFYDCSKARWLWEEHRETCGYKVDGLIFTPRRYRLNNGQCDNLIKWKPPEENTVDFKAVTTKCKNGQCRCDFTVSDPSEKGGVKVYWTTYIGSEQAELAMEYNGKIIECRWDCTKNRWVMVKLRGDKNVPNKAETADSVVRSIRDKIDDATLFEHFLRESNKMSM